MAKSSAFEGLLLENLFYVLKLNTLNVFYHKLNHVFLENVALILQDRVLVGKILNDIYHDESDYRKLAILDPNILLLCPYSPKKLFKSFE